MNNYYFTFGSDPLYPYGRDDYVKVVAKSLSEACNLFNLVHPPRPGTDLINCAFMYSESQFLPMIPEYYNNAEPTEIISLNVTKNKKERDLAW